MPRKREIKYQFFQNDEMAECSPLARLLFIGLWTIADREGRLEDRPKKIRGQILPYDEADGELLIAELKSHRFIARYEVDGSKFIQVLNFKKHQNPHPDEQASLIPAMPGLLASCEQPASKLQATGLQPASKAFTSFPSSTSLHGPCSNANTDLAQVENGATGHGAGMDPERIRVTIEDVSYLASEAFRRAGYSGEQGGNLWKIAALRHLEKISESEFFDSLAAAKAIAKSPPRVVFAALREKLAMRGVDLTTLLKEVYLIPKWPTSAPEIPHE